MYLHLGNDTIIKTNEIIGIFDLDNTTVSKKTRDFLYSLEKNNQVTTVSNELPKSFVVCYNGKTSVYINQLSSKTVSKRIKMINERSDVYE